MKNIIKAIKTLETSNPTVYLGGGLFCNLDLRTNEGLSKKVLNQCGLQLPKDYRNFISECNGFQCLEGACEFYDLGAAIEYTYCFADNGMPLYNESLLEIASIVEDYVFIDVTSPEGWVFISQEGISKPKQFNISFKKFLDAVLSTNAFKFWDYNPT